MSIFGAPNIERLSKRKDIDGLIKALSYQKDKEIRDNATLALARLRDVRAVQPLIDILKGLPEYESDEYKEEVIWILGELRDPRAINPLIKILDPEAFNPLDEDFGRLVMKNLLKKYESPRVLDAALDALFKIGEPAFAAMVQAKMVEPLVALLGETRLQNYKTSKAAEQKYCAQRKLAAILLGLIRSVRAVEPLISELAYKDYRETAASALINLGSLAVNPLIATLKDPNSELRAISAELLGKIGDIRSLAPLISALKDKDINVRKKAAAALGQMNDDRAIEALVKVLPDKNISRTVADSLKLLGWKPGKDLHGIQYFIAQNEWARVVEMGEVAIEPLIIILKKNSDDNLRRAAADALGQIRSQRAVDPLILALKDPDATLRGNASKALGKIGDACAIPSIIAAIQSEENNDVKTCLVEALSSMGTPAVEPLINLLGSDRILDRIVINSLGSALIDHRVVEPLITIIKNADGDYYSRRKAVEALAKIGDARAVEPLIMLLQGSDIGLRNAAAKSLVDLYISGKLNAIHKQRILESKHLITKGHDDTHNDWSSCGVTIIDEGHSIPGTGVEFPL